MRGKMIWAAAGAAVLSSGCAGSSQVHHSREWWSGYHAGETIYSQGSTTISGPRPKKSPTDLQLVDYCDQAAYGVEPVLPNMTQWLNGYSAGCYNG
jgi:hypothetical protein